MNKTQANRKQLGKSSGFCSPRKIYNMKKVKGMFLIQIWAAFSKNKDDMYFVIEKNSRLNNLIIIYMKNNYRCMQARLLRK